MRETRSGAVLYFLCEEHALILWNSASYFLVYGTRSGIVEFCVIFSACGTRFSSAEFPVIFYFCGIFLLLWNFVLNFMRASGTRSGSVEFLVIYFLCVEGALELWNVSGSIFLNVVQFLQRTSPLTENISI